MSFLKRRLKEIHIGNVAATVKEILRESEHTKENLDPSNHEENSGKY